MAGRSPRAPRALPGGAGARLLAALAAGGALAALGACSLLVTFDGRDAGAGGTTASSARAAGAGGAGASSGSVSAGSSSTASTGAAATSGAGGGPDGGDGGDGGACPAGMALVVAGGYCIDRTEVTNADYARFLAAPGLKPGTESPRCAWNATYQQAVDPDAGCDPGLDDPIKRGAYPATCVDWCDAYAYCAWAGKHLCGNIGGGAADFANDAHSEWFVACSTDGAHAYPYGDTFAETACACGQAGFDPAGVHPACAGGPPGVEDMSGNVNEWEDSCLHGRDPAADACHLRGGAYWYLTGLGPDAGPPALRCDAAHDAPPRGNHSNDWGFRCCK